MGDLNYNDVAAIRLGHRRNQLYKAAQHVPTLGDLFQALQADTGVDPMTKMMLVSQIRQQAAGMPDSTPLSGLIGRVLGGTLGMLISKYFGMGIVGQAVSALSGFGLASSLLGSRPRNPHPGWEELS